MHVIGLTGGIGTGKSSVARVLRDALSVPVLDADRASRTILEPGQQAFAQVVDYFGESILDNRGCIHRANLRALILNDASAKSQLEQITHPAIRAEISRQLLIISEAGAPYAVVEAALLVETGSYKQYHKLIVVTCDAQTQLERVMSRDNQSFEAAQRIIDSQLPMSEKVAVASVVIHNNGTLEELKQATIEAWGRITRNE